jgi:hypothetical protein
MLFDLRGRGRQRTVKTIYLALAILMGGGLVFFGIGGETSGGLFDAFSGSNTGGDGSERIERKITAAERTLRTDPDNEAAHVDLVRGHASLATLGEDRFDQSTQTYTEAGKAELREAVEAWNAYREAIPKPTEETARAASIMVGVFASLDDLKGATRAQEVVAETRESSGAYSQLAAYAYQAGSTALGDRAADKAVELEDPDLRKTLRQQLDQLKTQAAGAAATGTPTPAAG